MMSATKKACIVPVTGNSGMQPPCEPARMRQRLKQIAIGKSTQGYMNYRKCVALEGRDEAIHLNTPKTSPESNLRLSKREFEGELRTWRKFLHKYDDVDTEAAIPAGLRIGGSDARSETNTTNTECDSNASESMENEWQTGRMEVPEPPCYDEEYQAYLDYHYSASYPYYPSEYGYEYEPYYQYASEEYYPSEGFPSDPMEPEMPPLAPAPLYPCSLVEGTPASNLEAISAQLIALN
eukprot:TRINITY_DN30866_c0_g1_i1.p1 TRINITY_DN30866_c0_g1~~TRINITY_DN30866_c0_g1_i1.p1  ORF type:complete len:237 (+),score=51.27 TRINITY_DN30866_c0_g1_i1:50-760(+)